MEFDVIRERRRSYREGYLDGLWEAYHIIMKKINDVTNELHKDYPETRGEDPGY